MFYICFVFFFFKQKTAYEMRISDWSSDVCSSDLAVVDGAIGIREAAGAVTSDAVRSGTRGALDRDVHDVLDEVQKADRKSVVWGKSVSVRVDLGGRRIIKKKKEIKQKDNEYKLIKTTRNLSKDNI